MKTKHTPGPWNVWNIFKIASNMADVDEVDDIATVESGNIADARLIAAAPELLAALQAAESWIVDGGYLDDRNPHTSESAADVVHELRVAIAKATGEDTE